MTTRARGTERKQEERDDVCVRACGLCFACRHVRATSGFCILSQELTVQLTEQVCAADVYPGQVSGSVRV